MEKRILIIGLVFLFLYSSIVPISTGNELNLSNENQIYKLNSSKTLYVGGSGLNNYTNIQSAVDNASDGDTVFVYHDSSPYYENVFINKSIHLIGENRNTTVIDGNHSGDVIQINANNVTISGFTLQNGGNVVYYAGIAVENNYNYTIIFNNNIFNNGDGINVWSGSSYNNISDNNISYNPSNGIWIHGGGDPYNNTENVIHGNIISYNGGRGIFSTPLNIHKTKIIANRIFNNEFGGIDSDSSYDEICYNEIYSNKEYGICYGRGISVANVLISNNKIYHNIGYGIYLNGFIWGRLENFTIRKNHIESNSIDGIRMRWTNASKITQNNIYHNIVNAYFSNSFGNKWDGNYWGTSKRVKMIVGFIRPFDWVPAFITLIVVPWFNFDFHPAQEPYEIS